MMRHVQRTGSLRHLGLKAKVIAGGMVALAICIVPATSALALTGPAGQSLSVSPSTVVRGHAVTVAGIAPSCNTVMVLSDAFPSSNEFAGVPAVDATSTSGGHFTATVVIPVNRAPGSYAITARACGGNLGLSVTLVVTTGASVPATGASTGNDQGHLILGTLLLMVGAVAIFCGVPTMRPS